MSNGWSVYGVIPTDVWNGKQVILKVQVPLGGDMGSALVYDKTKSWKFFIPMDELEESGLNMGDKPKKYFLAHFDKDHTINFDKEVKEQQTW